MRAWRILRWCGAVLGVLILLVLSLWVFLQTGSGKELLAATASRLASGNGLDVEITGVEGSVPAAVTVKAIRLKDTRGVFAEINDLSLVWSPLRLLTGTLSIEQLRAGRVAVSRKPDLPQTESSGGSLPLFPVALNNLTVSNIELGDAVIGQAMHLALDGSAKLVDPAEGLALSFAVERYDEPGEIKGDVRYAPESTMLTIDVAASEPAGGIVARLAGISGLPALSASIQGSGRLDDWNGRLALAAGEAASASGTLAVRRVDARRRVMFDFAGAISPLVPENWRPLFAGRSEIMGSALVDAEGGVTIEGVNLRSVGVGFALVGKVDVAERTGNLSFDLVAGDAARFASLVPELSWADLRINASVKGELLRPAIDATLVARDLSGRGYSARQTTVTANTRPTADTGLSVGIEGDAEGLSAVDATVAKLLGPTASFNLSGTLSPDFIPSISAARIALAPLDVQFEGRASPSAVAGAIVVERADLAALAPLAGRPLSGNANAAIEISATTDLAELSLSVRGVARSVVTGITALDGFLQRETTISGMVEREADGSLIVDGFELVAYGLDLSVDGRIDEAKADLKAKLGIADIARIDSRVSGSVAAEAAVSGTLDSLGLNATVAMPSGTAMGRQIEGLALSVAATDLLGEAAGSVRLTGRVAGKEATGNAQLVTGADGERRLEPLAIAIGSVSAEGAVTLDAGGLATGRMMIAADDLADASALALTELGGRLRALVTLAARSGKQQLAVDATGSKIRVGDQSIESLDAEATVADLASAASAPVGNYRLTIARLSTPAIARAGGGPFDISAEGRLEGGRVGLDAKISAPSLKGATITGSVPIGTGAIALRVRGEADLGLANTFLAASGSRIGGTASVDMDITGTAAAPMVGGRIRISNGRFDDAVNGLTLTAIEGVLDGSSRSITVSSLSARTPNGGTISVRGDVAVDPVAGFPANVNVTLKDAALASNELMRLVASGALTLSGPVATRPRLAGRIDVRSLDINIPDRLGGGLPQLDVKHVNVAGGSARGATAGTKSTAARIAAQKARAGKGTFVADLDLRISAPNGVFVRGMGVDAELAGDVTIRGTSAAPVTLGGFHLRRGRFNVVGRQLDFTTGEITFEGSTDPELNLVAATRTTDVTAQIAVTGSASAPQIAFTSVPQLPQDEVLSRILFGRSIGSLTAGQAVQVAQTIAQFSGGGPGVMDKIRRSLGVDALDVGTDAAGTGGEVGIGKRLNDRIYLGVRQGTTPDSSKVTVDVDITRNIRVQGAAGADGENEIGIGAQWDY